MKNSIQGNRGLAHRLSQSDINWIKLHFFYSLPHCIHTLNRLLTYWLLKRSISALDLIFRINYIIINTHSTYKWAMSVQNAYKCLWQSRRVWVKDMHFAKSTQVVCVYFSILYNWKLTFVSTAFLTLDGTKIGLMCNTKKIRNWAICVWGQSEKLICCYCLMHWLSQLFWYYVM